MRPASLTINCARHGVLGVASVCGHLVQNFGAPLGFIDNCVEPDNKQGWCYACELVFEQEEDKTPRFVVFNQHAVVCSKCYDEIKAHHDIDADPDEAANDA